MVKTCEWSAVTVIRVSSAIKKIMLIKQVLFFGKTRVWPSCNTSVTGLHVACDKVLIGLGT